MLTAGEILEQDDLFDFEITPELLQMAAGFDSLGEQVRSGWIPSALLADLVIDRDQDGQEVAE